MGVCWLAWNRAVSAIAIEPARPGSLHAVIDVAVCQGAGWREPGAVPPRRRLAMPASPLGGALRAICFVQPYAGLLPRHVHAPGHAITTITAEAAARTGLPADCLICAGTTGGSESIDNQIYQ